MKGSQIDSVGCCPANSVHLSQIQLKLCPQTSQLLQPAGLATVLPRSLSLALVRFMFILTIRLLWRFTFPWGKNVQVVVTAAVSPKVSAVVVSDLKVPYTGSCVRNLVSELLRCWETPEPLRGEVWWRIFGLSEVLHSEGINTYLTEWVFMGVAWYFEQNWPSLQFLASCLALQSHFWVHCHIHHGVM